MSDSDPITRLNAALEGRYRIESELGEGGMATVYLADDLKHERRVALKVLKPELAAVVGAERFLAEIKTTANLQHPHILPLFDSGEADSFLFYVMPFIEGETLRDRLRRERHLPVDEAVRVGIEVADALDYAHRHGIVHRDVKPANVLLHEGRVMVADFGIALAVSAAGGGRLTETGLSMGTPHYMSPEQAAADSEVDARSDVYSLGTMVYEMLAGRPPHDGSSLQAVIAAVLTKVPPRVDADRGSIPEGLAAVVHRSIERLAADRFQSAAEFADALREPARYATGTAMFGPARSALKERGLWAAAVVGLVVALLLDFGSGAAPSGAAGPARFVLQVPYLSLEPFEQRVAVSPDGSTLYFVAPGESGYATLFQRRLNSLEVGEVSPRVFGHSLELSPAGRHMAYLTSGAGIVNLVDLARGTVTALPEGTGGGRWTGEDYYATSDNGVVRVSPIDGSMDTLFTVSEQDVDLGGSPRSPHLLPGGKGLLYSGVTTSPEYSDLFVYDFEREESRLVILDASAPTYLPWGVLLYVSADGALHGVEFDPDAVEILGTARVLESGLRWNTDLQTAYSVSDDGVLAYEREAVGGVEAVWVDHEGVEKPVSSLLPPRIGDVELSPDGSKLAYDEGDSKDVWVYDLEQNTRTRVSTGSGVNTRPTWTPDGLRVSFVSDRDGARAMYARPFDLSAPAEEIIRTGRLVQQIAWRADGAFIYREGFDDGGTMRDLFYRLPGDTESRELVVTEFDEFAPALSPAGDWLAYVSLESGRDEVYIRPFPGPGGRLTVSSDGGAEPAWSVDGSTLYYRSAADSLIAASLSLTSDQPRVGARTALFSTAAYGADRNDRRYTVHPDGERFIFVKHPPFAEIVVVTDWFTEVKELFGIN